MNFGVSQPRSSISVSLPKRLRHEDGEDWRDAVRKIRAHFGCRNIQSSIETRNLGEAVVLTNSRVTPIELKLWRTL